MTTTPTNPVPSYEQARAELGEVVAKLESGRVPLAESMALWERGEELATICQSWLDGARAKVEAARAQQDGRESAQPDGPEGGSPQPPDADAARG